MTASSRQEVNSFLKGQGFRLLTPSPGATASYQGALNLRGDRIPIILDVVDWDFRARPVIRLLERPPSLSGFRPHIGLGATLCYLDRESVLMDPYDPVGVVARCLLLAESTLEEIAGTAHRIDLQGEFLVNWSAPRYFVVLTWAVSRDLVKNLSIVEVDFPHREHICVITDDIVRTQSCLRGIGATTRRQVEGNAIELQSNVAPAIDLDAWPPESLRTLLTWMKKWDEVVYRTFMRALESDWSRNKDWLVVVIESPAGRFGFDFALPSADESHRGRLSKNAGMRRQRAIASDPQILRFTLCDLSPRFIHGRNQPTRETLAGRNISIIGCGAVGGFLATYLAKLGAGSAGGALALFDTQDMMPENLGRHVLSMRELFRNKADGVKDEIHRGYPYLTIIARAVDALRAEDLFATDLVIDATGTSAVSSALNRLHLERLTRGVIRPAVLYVWVEGAGEAARSLLVDSLDFMCFECQYLRPPGQALQDRFVVSTRELTAEREYPGGCASYMPFAVSAATSAAGLALDVARDWNRDIAHPRLRTRRLNCAATRAREDSSPAPLKSCPACQRS